jgi:uncharacterized protein (TIGR00725 family)
MSDRGVQRAICEPANSAGGDPMPIRRPQAVVIGDTDAAPDQLHLAEAVGALIAQLGMTLITGGRGGVMEAAARGAAGAGGTTVGIVPSADPADANAWCQIAIPTGMGHARNALTALAGDVVIVIGGAAGTLSEIAFAWMSGRPIVVLAGSGGWADEMARRPPDARQSSSITACSDTIAVEATLREICAARNLALAAPA